MARTTGRRFDSFVGFFEGRGSRRRGPLAAPAAERIAAFDARVDQAVDRHRSTQLDRLFYGLSSAADHGLLWLAIGTLRAAVQPRRLRGVVRLAAVLGVESALTNGVIKSFFRRVRPPEHYPPEPAAREPLPYGMHRPITSSFPSGHAASGFTAATILAEDDPLGPAYYTLAALVAASRVYVRMHHASDVTAGTAWGLAFGRLARRTLRGR